MAARISTVNFHGAPLTVVTSDKGQRLVAMKPICDAIGLEWHGQRQRIKRHPVLSEGAVIITAPSTGGDQEATCLPLDMLNGWLFGVDANRVKPEIRDTLLQYQRECFGVLAAHWQGTAGNKRLEERGDPLKGLPRIVYRNEPVLTFEMVDQLHGRKHGHTSKSYYRDLNQGLLQQGVHFFKVPLADRQLLESAGITLHRGGLVVLTQDGYEQVAGHYTEPGAEQTRQRVLAGYFNQGASDAPTDAQLRALREAAQLLGLWVDIQRTASNEEKITRLNQWRDAVHALFEHGEPLGDMLKTQRHTEAESLLISRLQLEAAKADDATYISNMLNQQLKEISWAKRHRLLGRQ